MTHDPLCLSDGAWRGKAGKKKKMVTPELVVVVVVTVQV